MDAVKAGVGVLRAGMCRWYRFDMGGAGKGTPLKLTYRDYAALPELGDARRYGAPMKVIAHPAADDGGQGHGRDLQAGHPATNRWRDAVVHTPKG